MSSNKRSLTVIKELQPPSPKKKLYVTHKLDASSVDEDDFAESLKGNPSPQKAIRKADGSLVPWSILGDSANYEHIENGGATDDKSQAGSVSVRTSRSSRSRNKGGSRSGKKTSSKTLNVPADPHQDLKDHIAALCKFKEDAAKVRSKEKLEEEEILLKLPVHEKFSLNKEGKALSKWQERLNDWSNIENRLSRRVGGSTKTLLMNSGDEYRGKNEEYDIMQAAIPVQEKFGPNSWKMSLRGGGEQNVPVGHIFSGLVCKVTTKQVIPRMLRKPLLGAETRTKDSFLEQTAALTIKRAKLKKKIEEIRPYSMGPSIADGLLVISTDLFTWAHDSSKRILLELEENERFEEEMRKQQLLDEQNRNANNISDDPVSSLRILSPTNVVFTCLKGESSSNVFSFTNTGRATITFSWVRYIYRFDEVDRPVRTVLEKKEDKEREFVLYNDRSLFFCPKSTGRVLPGETISTMFVYYNNCSSGTVSEQWVLQLSPQANVSYADVLKRSDVESPKGVDQAAQAQPPTSKVSIQLRGQSLTLDQSGYRRAEAYKRIISGSVEAFVQDQLLECIRKVRVPVRPLELQRRKIQYFMTVNSSVLSELSNVFIENLPLRLDYSRLQDIEKCYVNCQDFVTELHQKCDNVVAQWQELSGSSDIIVPEPIMGRSGTLRLEAMRSSIFPEKTLEVFDEITEEDISPMWDYDMTRIFAICNSARSIISTIIDAEEKIKEKVAHDEKEAARIARKAAAGSDDESDEDDEEEEEDDEEPKPVVVHPLTSRMCSVSAAIDGLLYRLVTEPISLPGEDAKSALTSTLNSFEDIELTSREIAGIHPDSAIPIFASPFTSEEGKASWDAALHPPAEEEDTGKKGKKAPEKKDKKKDKGAVGEVPIVEPDQANIFYKDMCSKIVSSLLDNLVEEMFSAVDTRCVMDTKEKLSTSSVADLSTLSVLRREDVPQKGIVFMSVHGASLFPTDCASAFDIGKAVRQKYSDHAVLCCESGCSGVVLLFESRNARDVTLIENISLLQESLNESATVSARKQELARPKPKKKDPPLPSITPSKYKVSVLPSFAELHVALKKLQVDKPSKKKSFPVFVLQDIKSPSVVPADLFFPDEVNDDDECPIPVGMSEYHKQRLSQWNDKGPKQVGVETAAGIIETFAGPAEALADTLRQFCVSSPGLWVECDPSSLFAPNSVSGLQRCAEVLLKSGDRSCHRVVSEDLRDLSSWISVLQQIPRVTDILGSRLLSEDNYDPFCEHINNLFGKIESVNPKLVLVIGGALRLDKFLVLDKLLDSASVVYVGGEMCIPFLSLVRNVNLVQYSTECGAYKTLCCELLSKARLRGVRLVFPVDIVEGDEPVSEMQKRSCFEKIEPSARDEGADYPGETRTVQLPSHEYEDGNFCDISPLTISGFIYDIGAASCQELKQEIVNSEVLLSWGPLGCVEMSSFQGGQRTLATAAAKKPYSIDDEPAAIAENAATLPLYSIVVGDSCVEWWSRITDSEGENGGEIARCGIVACAVRDSSSVCGLLSGQESVLMNSICKREPNSDEWMYNNRPPPPVEEDEEDEDDEEDDD